MKKYIALLLALVLVFSLAGCKKDKADSETPTKPTNQEVTKPDKETTPTTTPDTEATEPSQKPEETTPPETEPEFTFDGVANPVEEELDVTKLPDGIYHIAIQNGGIASVDGVAPVTLNAVLYKYDKYDVRELSYLNKGDKLIVNGKEIIVESYDVTKMGIIMINNGLGHDGYEFAEDADGMFYNLIGENKRTFYEVGPISIPVADDFVYYDAKDLDKESKRYTLNDFTINDVYFEYEGKPEDTVIEIKDGKVVEMTIGRYNIYK